MEQMHFHWAKECHSKAKVSTEKEEKELDPELWERPSLVSGVDLDGRWLILKDPDSAWV